MKATIPTIAAFSTAFSSTFGSSIAVGAQDFITTKFGIAPSKGTLIVSLYLVGCAMGPFFYAPMGEIFGRKIALGTGITLMLVFAAASAAAPNWSSLLAFRFLAGLGASAPMIVSAGILADIFKDSAIRGYIITCLMAVTTLGSLVSSIISLQIMAQWPESWSLCFWTHTAISGLSWLIVLIMPETNTISKTPHDVHNGHSAPELLQRIFLPTRMALFEPIVLATCMFLSLQYSIFYLFFQLIPPLFERAGYVSVGNSGVLFVPFAVGTIIASLVYIFFDPVLGSAAAKRPKGRAYPESRRLPPAYLGGFMIVLALFFMGYCIGRRVHFGYPLFLEGMFGYGFLLIFIGLTNYVVDAYQALASSALASSFVVRNIMGAALPLVSGPMQRNLEDRWSFYLLGFLSLPLACVVCGFQFYGPHLRFRSPLCKGLAEREREGSSEVSDI